MLSTKVSEVHRQDLPHLIVGRTGNAYATWLCQCLQSSRYVNSIPKQVTRPDHYVADVNAYAKIDPAVRRKT
jgi:hypothetical protein